jgi:hypothetical protein
MTVAQAGMVGVVGYPLAFYAAMDLAGVVIGNGVATAISLIEPLLKTVLAPAVSGAPRGRRLGRTRLHPCGSCRSVCGPSPRQMTANPYHSGHGNWAWTLRP